MIGLVDQDVVTKSGDVIADDTSMVMSGTPIPSVRSTNREAHGPDQ
jgi:hypothetical protein